MRVEGDLDPDPIKAKIGEAERARAHTMLVIGGRDVDAGNVSVRLHSKGPQGAETLANHQKNDAETDWPRAIMNNQSRLRNHGGGFKNLPPIIRILIFMHASSAWCRLSTARLFRMVFVAFVLAFNLQYALAQLPGSVDATFQASVSNTVAGLLLAPDGKVYVKFGHSLYTTTRLLPEGTVDFTFAPGLPAGSRISAVALQADGKIIITGDFQSVHGVPRPCIARLNEDCSLDTSFVPALSLAAIPSPSTNSPPLPGGTPKSSIGFVFVSGDGKVLISGLSYVLAADGSSLPQVVRLNPDGNRDNSFATITSAHDKIFLRDDGKIILLRNNYYGGTAGTATLSRFNIDGTPDATFTPPEVTGYINSVCSHNNGLILGGGMYRINGLAVGHVARLHDNGALDTSFQSTVWGEMVGVATLLPLPDGKILVGGGLSMPEAGFTNLVRLNSNGSLDMTFAVRAGTYVYALALQPDGKLLVGGEFRTIGGMNVRRLARLMGEPTAGAGRFLLGAPSYEVFEGSSNVCVAIRRDWGTIGQVTANFQITSGTAVAGSDYGAVAGTVVFEDGESQKLVVIPIIDDKHIEDLEAFQFSLQSVSDGEMGGTTNTVISILDDDGPASIDPTFVVKSGSFDGAVKVVAIQPDGRILVGGDFQQAGGVARRGIARLNVDASTDPSFNPGSGLGLGSYNGWVTALKCQPDGKILLGGPFDKVNGVTRKYMARLNGDGSLDTSFDVGTGMRTYNRTVGGVEGLALLANGQIIVGGYFDLFNDVPRSGLARLNSDGALDLTYNPTGAQYVASFGMLPDERIVFASLWNNTVTRINADGTIDLSSLAQTDYAVHQLNCLPDGRILIAGTFKHVGIVSCQNISRLLSNGTVDPAFNSDLSAFSGDELTYIRRFAVQPDGKIVIAVKSWRPPVGQYIARLNTDGSVDTDFEPVHFSVPWGDTDTIYAVEIQPDGKIVVGGRFQHVNGLPRSYLVRLRGSADGAARQIAVKSFEMEPQPQLSLAVRPGTTFVLETSTNLINWVPISTNISPVSAVTASGVPPTGSRQRFYRVMQVAP